MPHRYLWSHWEYLFYLSKWWVGICACVCGGWFVLNMSLLSDLLEEIGVPMSAVYLCIIYIYCITGIINYSFQISRLLNVLKFVVNVRLKNQLTDLLVGLLVNLLSIYAS
jgi:hypothetical protein